MAYEKLNWQDGKQPALNAENLNHMEDGIANATAGMLCPKLFGEYHFDIPPGDGINLVKFIPDDQLILKNSFAIFLLVDYELHSSEYTQSSIYRTVVSLGEMSAFYAIISPLSFPKKGKMFCPIYFNTNANLEAANLGIHIKNDQLTYFKGIWRFSESVRFDFYCNGFKAVSGDYCNIKIYYI